MDHIILNEEQYQSLSNDNDNGRQAAIYKKEIPVSIEDILMRLDKIMNDNSLIQCSIAQLETPVDDNSRHGAMGAAKYGAIGQIVQSREATNQTILTFLEKMYDDLVSNSKN